MDAVKWREQRQVMANAALVSMARTGHAVALEVCADVEKTLGLEPGNRAVKRAVFEDLPSLGWVHKETVRVFRGVRLTLVRVDWDGSKALYRFGVRSVCGEWQTLIEGHAGERYERHTLGVLILAWQARKRGHRVKLLPGRKSAYASSSWWVEPDLEIEFFDGGRSIGFVPWEFEVKPRGKDEKWLRWERLVGGWGVATFTAKRRESLAREIERAGGREAWMADVETLMKHPETRVYVPAPYGNWR